MNRQVCLNSGIRQSAVDFTNINPFHIFVSFYSLCCSNMLQLLDYVRVMSKSIVSERQTYRTFKSTLQTVGLKLILFIFWGSNINKYNTNNTMEPGEGFHSPRPPVSYTVYPLTGLGSSGVMGGL